MVWIQVDDVFWEYLDGGKACSEIPPHINNKLTVSTLPFCLSKATYEIYSRSSEVDLIVWISGGTL